MNDINITVENELRSYIIEKFKSITEFCKVSGIPNSTMTTIFKRGASNANVSNIIKMCNVLAIDVDALADGKISPKQFNVQITSQEKALLNAYRLHKEMQPAINKMLDIEFFSDKNNEEK